MQIYCSAANIFPSVEMYKVVFIFKPAIIFTSTVSVLPHIIPVHLSTAVANRSPDNNNDNTIN